jgi:hypothetical protein
MKTQTMGRKKIKLIREGGDAANNMTTKNNLHDDDNLRPFGK